MESTFWIDRLLLRAIFKRTLNNNIIGHADSGQLRFPVQITIKGNQVFIGGKKIKICLEIEECVTAVLVSEEVLDYHINKPYSEALYIFFPTIRGTSLRPIYN